MQASPASNIYIEPEVNTGGATDVTLVSAVLHGQLPDGEYEGFSDYGIRYSKGGEGWTEVRASKDSSGSFSIEADGLEEDTAYQYLAYLRFDGKEYLGAVETFITGREPDEEEEPETGTSCTPLPYHLGEFGLAGIVHSDVDL